ncbi:MAG: B12-binding domain-containing radical SAM protein [Deltaproteobacteria bacterium]|nr:B12-binding domain-containing radical SAM protein [Deltaproteobacteria bacterium]
MPTSANPQVILIQPAIGYMDFLRSAPSPPLGLMAVSTGVPEGVRVRLLDARLDSGWRSTLAAWLREAPTVAVGLTSYTSDMLVNAMDAARIVRESGPTPVIWGGVHASLTAQQTAAHELVDAVVIGEGEETFGEIVSYLIERRPLGEIPGIAFSENGRVSVTAKRPLMRGERIPLLPTIDADLRPYLPTYQGVPTLYTQGSRGCPYDCTYCYNTVMNDTRWRAIEPERLFEHILALRRKHDFGSVYFVDDNFFINKKRALRLAELFLTTDLTYEVQGVDIYSLARLTDDDLRLVEKSGCKRVTIGIESGSERIRTYIKKQGDVPQVVEQVRRLANFQLNLFASFMTGLPSETEDDTRQTAKLMVDLLELNSRFRTSPLYLFTPFPGTEVYQDAVAAGFRAPDSLAGWARVGEWNRYSWDDGDKKEKFERLHFASIFIDRKINDYSRSWPLRLASTLYRPIARARMRRFYFGMMIEKAVADLLMPRFPRAPVATTPEIRGKGGGRIGRSLGDTVRRFRKSFGRVRPQSAGAVREQSLHPATEGSPSCEC